MNEMKTINHHLTDQLLMGYSSGNLPEAFNLVVATHLSMCDECRAALDAYDAVGGSLLDTDETSEMDSSSLAATMKLIAAKPAVKKSAPKSNLPAPLANYIGGDLESVKWRPVGMGVRQAILKTSTIYPNRMYDLHKQHMVPPWENHQQNRLLNESPYSQAPIQQTILKTCMRSSSLLPRQAKSHRLVFLKNNLR